MDSTLRSNISVGLPLDLLVYQADSLAVTRFVSIDERNQYFQMIRNSWGSQLKRVFEGIEDPVWDASAEASRNVLSSKQAPSQPLKMQPPPDVAPPSMAVPVQTLAQQDAPFRQP